ncbi:rhodanese-like domain-containing protein [Hyphobacterium sp. CCMP332]|nr:rhodanese-like domain-containing protein [Hyphobacterium sp. CCMP332]
MDINPEELNKKINLKDSEIVIIDVREDWEYEENHIAPYNIPLYSIPKRLNEFKQWKNKKIIVHCNSGKRSVQAQKFLRSQGIVNVYNLTGGLDNFYKVVKINPS